MSLINPAYISRRKEANVLIALLMSRPNIHISVSYISDEREVEFYNVPCLTYPSSIYTVSQMSFMHHETCPPYVHGNCTAVFPLTSTIFPQIKSASFNKSDKLPDANCWPVNFSDRVYYLIFSFLSRHTANGAWLLPKVASYRFNDVELTQLSSASSGFSHVKTAGCSVQFLFPLSYSHTRKQVHTKEPLF